MIERITKLNCWEFMKCGRQPGVSTLMTSGCVLLRGRADLMVFMTERIAGRACWVVAGSLCGGTIQGSFAEKFRNCEKCNFYKRV